MGRMKFVQAAIAFVAAGSLMAGTATAGTVHFEGFESAGWTAGQTDNWQNNVGTITRAVSGTNGIASSDGVAHAVLSGAGPFTRFGGYSSVFGGGFTTSLDVYLDPNWSDGTGFDYSAAASRQTGAHLRDFIFHVGVVSGDLLVNASNNTDFTVNAYKLVNENGGNNFTVTAAGWYTFEQVFRDDGGVLAVDFNLYDAGGTLKYTVTRSDPTDSIATVVGGNRYGWFTANTATDLAIDNTELRSAVVPLPAAAMPGLIMLGGLALRGRNRRRLIEE